MKGLDSGAMAVPLEEEPLLKRSQHSPHPVQALGTICAAGFPGLVRRSGRVQAHAQREALRRRQDPARILQSTQSGKATDPVFWVPLNHTISLLSMGF